MVAVFAACWAVFVVVNAAPSCSFYSLALQTHRPAEAGVAAGRQARSQASFRAFMDRAVVTFSAA